MKRRCLISSNSRRAFSLIELLCVMVIIAILVSLLLPTVFRAYNKVKGMAEEAEAPEVSALLLREARKYCSGHPQFQFQSKSDFADKCNLLQKCRNWVNAGTTEFVPFGYLDPTNKTVLSVHLGPKHQTLYSYTKADLSITPENR